MAQLEGIDAHGRGEIVRRQIARAAEGRRAGVEGVHGLIGGAPGEGLDGLGLLAGVDLGVELEQCGAELQRGDRRGGGLRQAGFDVGAAGEHQLAVGLGAGDEKVPVAAVVLDQVLVAVTGAGDGGIEAGVGTQLAHHVAVGFVEIGGTVALEAHFGGRVAAFDEQLRRGAFAHLEALAHHQALEEQVRAGCAGQDLDLGAGHEKRVVAEREVAAGGVAVAPGQPRRGDVVGGAEHADRHELVGARHGAAVHLHGELPLFSIDGERARGVDFISPAAGTRRVCPAAGAGSRRGRWHWPPWTRSGGRRRSPCTGRRGFRRHARCARG